MKVKTLRTTANDCPNKWDCPSVHEIDTDPGRRYVVSKRTSAAERHAFADVLHPGEILGWVPAGFLASANAAVARARHVADPALPTGRQYVFTVPVTDPAVLAVFGDLMSRDEQLGRVDERDLAVL